MSVSKNPSRIHARSLAVAILLIIVSLPAFPAMSISDDGQAGGNTMDGPSSRDDEPVVFANVTNTSGIGAGSRPRVAWGDYNSDGLEDLLLGGQYLFRNDGDGTFTDVSFQAGIGGNATGAVWGDYDNDGWLDFYQTHGGGELDKLYHNEGNGVFTDVTSVAGQIADDLPSEGAGWGDYDRDGLIDLYVANYEWPPDSAVGQPDVLYHNEGGGKFSNVTAQASMTLPENYCGRGVNWGDFNNDGWPDIYVSNYRLDPNLLWRNNKDGTFTNVAEQIGVAGNKDLTGNYGHTIGSAWADFDNDGDLDLFTANLAHPRYIAFSDISHLYVNNGPPNYDFSSIPIMARGITYEETHSNPSWGDYDNDGDMDLFITSVYDGRPTFLYRNNGDGTFVDVTQETNVLTWDGWGSAWGDYNNDGFLDMVVGSGNASDFRLFQNGKNPNRWLELDLEGTASNRDAIGTRAYVIFNNTTVMREVFAGSGTTSEDSLVQHFGLGGWSKTVDIKVVWPRGAIQWLRNVTLEQKVKLVEPPNVPDFVLEGIAPSVAIPVEGDILELNITYSNMGAVCGTVWLELVVDGTPVSKVQLPPLAPYMTTAHTLAWNTTNRGGHKSLEVRLVDSAPQELKTDNNIGGLQIYVNKRPVAVIEDIQPKTGERGKDTFIFQGAATDDTKIMGYKWTSSLDGVLSVETDFTFAASDMTAGTHEIELVAQDDYGVWSHPAKETLSVTEPPEPLPPTARIIDITPNPATSDEPVTFRGTATDDHAIVEYKWTSSIDGVLSNRAEFTKNELTPGTHQISLAALDDDNLWSPTVQETLLVELGNRAPDVSIELVSKDVIEEGDRVVLTGKANDPDGDHLEYLWRSDLDGILSRDLSFATEDLSIGDHNITFKASDGVLWSNDATTTIKVKAKNIAPTIEMFMNEGTVIKERTAKVTGSAFDKEGALSIVQVKVDSGNWQKADGLDEWSYELDAKALGNGKHVLKARAYDGEEYSELAIINFTVKLEDKPALFGIETGPNICSIPFLYLVIFAVIAIIILAAAYKGGGKGGGGGGDDGGGEGGNGGRGRGKGRGGSKKEWDDAAPKPKKKKKKKVKGGKGKSGEGAEAPE